jgi:hypothetical protein
VPPPAGVRMDDDDWGVPLVGVVAMVVFSMVENESLFVWLVADGWCWFVLREKYYWLIAGGWFVLKEKYCWLVANKPNEQAANL